MKQILQSLKTGATEIVEIPSPQIKPGHLLIRTTQSLISPGTERMLVDFGKASLLDKARQQPDKVRMMFDKIKTDGLLSTLDAVRAKLDQKIPMGYCNVGTVVALGQHCEGFSLGDRVVSNGAHAEIVCVPKNLCCKIPDGITDEDASFTVLGAIALQGMRLAKPTLGETFVVIGLGIIGLLTVQLLRANGCRVLAIDIDPKKIEFALQFGAKTVNPLEDDVISCADEFSRHRGVDGVLITASSKSNEPIHQAAKMCRKRGRIILIGVTGLALSRADFYEKELFFQVSCSYGPGRYDSTYEEQGHDYPIGFVRWTEQRNFEAFLDMLVNGTITLKSLISHRFPINEAHQAYELLSSGTQALGILLEYAQQNPHQAQNTLIQLKSINPKKEDDITIGLIGAGNYASRILIPAFIKTNVSLKLIACSGGISGLQVGKKFGFDLVTTDTTTLFSDPAINTVIIASRHDNHSRFVCEAFAADKHIFVEKPLCLTLEELDNIVEHRQQSPSKILMVGFNRRFAPHIVKIKSLLKNISEPKSFIMTVNAGEIPADHWTQNLKIGGGRIIGEVCHFIDLLRFLADAPIISFHVIQMDKVDISSDKVSISLLFRDGSFGVIHYLANGHRSFPKERLEIFTSGKVLQLDNFRRLRGYGWPYFRRMNLWSQDKGQTTCVREFVHAIKLGLPAPIPFAEIIEVSKVTIEIAEACAST